MHINIGPEYGPVKSFKYYRHLFNIVRWIGHKFDDFYEIDFTFFLNR